MESPKSYMLRVKKQELIKIKEELKKAKENATQSWLDSRPLIDDLETLKSNLEISKNKVFIFSNSHVSELEKELETMNAEIKSRKEEELEATKKANEVTQALDQLREEMESLKRFTGNKRQKKLKLKRVLRLQRQRLRSLQLRIEAARKDIEACGESRKEALRYLNIAPETIMEKEGVDDHGQVLLVLSHEEYMARKKRVDEENSLADWRVSVSVEQKMEAEKSRDLAKAKLRELKLWKRAKGRRDVRESEGDHIDIERVVVEEEEEEDDKREVTAVISIAQPKKEDFQVPETIF
ncbi:protein WEAK CHLOROPLAST MOVEMENT UNDER BLUE LIGHT-like 3 [Morus notabilis]|uniref:protein WEAK CHLOROPLAST MOVEMENT UNDER BLUE LIGHT-like 3 n=1 Tax=Morus notabilis TaxID=981085 RepID=UPI000CECF804|nr:protein WEAK CHLOROPLAST MOVEMENT UNDER BLUE LIGHT-like 3 [Morus notabilis]